MSTNIARLEKVQVRAWESRRDWRPGRTRVLVVEDDPILLGLHAAILELEGYDVEVAEDGMEALWFVAMRDFDLVLTDGSMPRLDGIGLVRELRRAGSRVPVVMVSASLSTRPLPVDVAREVSAAIPKPARPAEILHAITHTLRGSAIRHPSTPPRTS
jgi:DNA-binding response OmpR family regulator